MKLIKTFFFLFCFKTNLTAQPSSIIQKEKIIEFYFYRYSIYQKKKTHSTETNIYMQSSVMRLHTRKRSHLTENKLLNLINIDALFHELFFLKYVFSGLATSYKRKKWKNSKTFLYCGGSHFFFLGLAAVQSVAKMVCLRHNF